MSAKPAVRRFLLVYASQTGQAQAISEVIRDRAVERGLEADMHCLSESEKKFNLEKESVVVIVTSTTGDGDPPDTASKFWRKLKKKGLPRDHLSRCKYALLGLGDSNYTNFCNMGKMLNRRILELGATQFYEPGFADDGVGLDLVVEPWIDGLWAPLDTLLRAEHTTATPKTTPTSATETATPTTKAIVDECSTPNRTISKTKSASEVVKKPDVASLPVAQASCTATNALRGSTSDSSLKVGTGREVTGKTSSGDAKTGKCVATNHRIHSDKVTPSSRNRTDKVVPNSGNRTQSTCTVPDSGNRSQKVLLPNPSGGAQDLATKLGVELKISRPEVDIRIEFPELERELKAPAADLRGAQLTLPSVSTPHIAVRLTLSPPGRVLPFPYCQVHYGIKSSVTRATITGKRLLTKEGAVKKTIEVQMRTESLSYEPGFAFGFVCPNVPREVDYILQRLKLERQANSLMHLSIVPGTAKKYAVLPKHIPVPCSVRHFFTHCADIRCVPKKALLSLLSTYCSADGEKRRLQELASRQGAGVYTRLFTQLHTDLLDVLHTFSSCQPPLQRLVESLPRLQPRFYSAACSRLAGSDQLRIAFSVMELPKREWLGGKRQGLSSGWFDREGQEGVQVPLVPRAINLFHLPSDPSLPIVMIGPGTGVAPFIGFLQHRRCQREAKLQVGKSWLFFGCRHPDQDYLYREELEGFLSDGTLTHLHVSFSRLDHSVISDSASSSVGGGGTTRYVQEEMTAHWRELGKWVMEEGAVIYVCGDAVNMSKDIRDVWLHVLAQYLQEKDSSYKAECVLTKLKDDGRYLLDVWT